MDNKKKEWHNQQEKILKKWAEVSSSYRYLHDRSYTLYSEKNLYFALPVIILSTITGTANFAQSSFPDSIRPYAPSLIGSLNLIAGLITTVSQFLRVSELLESHRVASLAFGKLSRNIAVELSLPVKERTSNGTTFLSTCRVELDKLIEQSPSIPLSILSKFDKKFSESDFIKPDILEITSVEIYRNNELEESKIKEKLLQLEKEKREQIIKEENDRKMKAYEEIKKQKQKTKKKKLSTFSVHKSLDKLLTDLNPIENKNDNLGIELYDNTSSSDVSTDDQKVNILETSVDLVNSINENIEIKIEDNNEDEKNEDIEDDDKKDDDKKDDDKKDDDKKDDDKKDDSKK